MKKLAPLAFVAALLTACGTPTSNSTLYVNPSGNWKLKVFIPSSARDLIFNIPISDPDATGKFSGKSIIEVEGTNNLGISLTGDFVGSYKTSEIISTTGQIELYQKLPPKPDGTAHEICIANNHQYNTKIVITGNFYEKEFYGRADYQPCIGGAFRAEHNDIYISGTKK